MSSEKLTFFDLPSQNGAAWSLNPWRIRMLLNFKGVDYETHWTEYPDIKATLEAHVPPNEVDPNTDYNPLYTIPAIKFPDGTYLMGTWPIAEAINERYPEPAIELKPVVKDELLAAMQGIMNALKPIYYSLIPQRILNEASHEHWNRTRTEYAGMPLEQYRSEQGGDVAWNAAEPHIREATALLEKNMDGPFFDGKTVTYVDFYWASFLIFLQRIDMDEVFGELLKRSGDAQVHLNLLKACEPWTKRNDH